MAILYVEKLGGLAGFGGSRSHIRSHGQIDTAVLSAADQKTVDLLFESGSNFKPPRGADAFRFRITRSTVTGTEIVEVNEDQIPAALASCVKDEFV